MFFVVAIVVCIILSSRRKGNVSERVPLPPPVYGAASFSSSKPSHSTSFKPSVPPYQEDSRPVSSAPPATSSTYDNCVSLLLSLGNAFCSKNDVLCMPCALNQNVPCIFC